MSDYEDENEYEQEEYEPEYEEEHEDEYEDEYEEEQEFEPEYHEYEEEYEKEFEDVPEYQEDFQEEEFGKGVEMNAFGEGGRLYFISDRDNLFRKFESNKNKSQLQRFQEIIAVTCNTLKIKEKINIIIPYTDDIKDVSNLNAPCFVLGYLCIKDNEINISNFNDIINSEKKKYIQDLNSEFGSNIKPHDVLRYAKFWRNLLNKKIKK
jgi:hypothetical protein